MRRRRFLQLLLAFTLAALVPLLLALADRIVTIRPGYRRSIQLPDGTGKWRQESSVTMTPGERIVVQPTTWVAPTPVPTPTPTPGPGQTGDLQALINAAAPGATINYSGTHTGAVTVNKALTIVGGRVNGSVTITANNVTLRNMAVLGPQFASYLGTQNAIYAANVSGVTLDQVEAGNVGNAAVRLHFVTGFTITTPNIHDTVYAGIITTSSTDGLIDGGSVQRIGMNGSSAANSNNAYGIILTQFLPTDPHAARITVRNVTVVDVPTWHGLDTHGGQGLLFENNVVQRAYRGVMLTGGSATGGPGDGNIVRGNRIEEPSSPNIGGVVVVENTHYQVTGNTINGAWTRGVYVLAGSCGTVSGNTITGATTPIVNNGTVC